MAEIGEYLPASWVDPYGSESSAIGISLRPPRTWLVRRYYVSTSPVP
jgi:hypothetical protein